MSFQPLSDARSAPPVHIHCFSIFLVFSKLSLAGFGGVLPFAYRALVERERWLTAEEFAEFLAFSQVLPGPTICNVALMVGNRYAGTRGALAALAGMIVIPFLIVIALGMVYQTYGNLEVFRNALNGMAAVATGLILATAVKMGLALFRKNGLRNKRSAFQIALLVLAFIGLGVLKWRLLLVFGILAPLGTMVFYLMGGRK